MQTYFSLRILCGSPLVSFPGRGKFYLLGDCVPSSAPQNGFLSKMHTLGQAVCPKLGKNVHLGSLLILQGLTQSVLIVETLRNKFCFKLILIKQISYK